MTTFRQRTRAIVIVHSHISKENNEKNGNVYDLSSDVIAISTNKATKGVGTFSLTLVPRKNYFNYLFPNDVVNIYFDPGDGERGFVRTMMGYIDRVDRTESVDANGAMTTTFTVTGSDFAKAVQHTDIVFNPMLAQRGEFVDKRFGLSNLFGDALRSRGIPIFGSPAQFVENILSLLMGFGTQWVLPKNYGTIDALVNKSRSKRVQRYKAQIPSETKAALASLFQIDVSSPDVSAEELQKSIEKVNKQINDDAQKKISGDEVILKELNKNGEYAKIYWQSTVLQAFQTLLKETNDKSYAGLLDLLSFDFIESQSISGFIQSQHILQEEGSVLNIVIGHSNEMVNELIFDLRPVATDNLDGDFCFGSDTTYDFGNYGYSRAPDELGINVKGNSLFPASVSAVKYMPSVVFREYPHAVISNVDLTNYTTEGQSVGNIEFGAIFAQSPNVAGRKIVRLKNQLCPDPQQYTTIAPYKHLDVETITNQDVISSNLGRSDAEVFNFFEMHAANPALSGQQNELSDFSPVLPPVSIFRNGLRRRKLVTDYAEFGKREESSSKSTIVRWVLLQDHWTQHNHEYLSGSITMRARPDIRVGYRLDWTDRNESYYVEGVSHSWNYPGAFQTTVQVSRGQRNDPYPLYVPPILVKHTVGTIEVPSGATQAIVGPVRSIEDFAYSAIAEQGGGNRQADGRLGQVFEIKDTGATKNAVGGSPKSAPENLVDKEEYSGAVIRPAQNTGQIDMLIPPTPTNTEGLA